MRGLRGAKLLGNANNASNAGSLYLNGNNAVSDANANWGAFLNDTYKMKESEPDPMVEHDIRWQRAS